MTFDNSSTTPFFPGRPASKGGNADSVSFTSVGPDYFQAIGARILRGRPITEQDNNNSRHVAVVNQAFAKKYFEGDAIGRHFGIQAQLNSQFEIVGVTEDTKYNNPDQPAPPMFFLAMDQSIQVAPPFKPEDAYFLSYARNIVIAFHGSAAGKEREIRAALTDVNPDLAPQHLRTFEDQVSLNLNGEILIARLTLLFGLTALVLAAIGLYGVTSYSVARRTGEIGIRMALGANRAQVLRTVMRRAMAQALLGLALGIPLAWLAGRLLAGRIYQVSSFDPLIVTVTVACLAVSAALAALLPARRAAGVNPVEALRNE
jgi:predicted permease